MEARAEAKKVRIQPRKARLTIDLIRNKSVAEAFNILNNLNNKGSEIIVKVLASAVANAENNLELKQENLYVSEAFVNEGETLKRFKVGSRSHMNPILKRTSHIIVKVKEFEEK